MSIRHVAQTWAHFEGRGSALLLMLALADFADDEGFCYPSVRSLATKTRMSERQVQRLLNDFVQKGLISVVANASGGAPGATRRYALAGAKVIHTGDTDVTRDISQRVTQLCRKTGDIAMSPNPSINRHKKERIRARTRANLQPLPDAWQPNAGHEDLAGKLQVDLHAEVEAFRDHHASKGSRFADWDAALRTWLRNAAKWRRPATTKPTTTQPTTRWQAQENRKDWLNDLLGRNRKPVDIECDARTVDSPPF